MKRKNSLDFSEVQIKVLLILGICFLFVIIITKIQSNSFKYNKREYDAIREKKYSGKIVNLFEERNQGKRFKEVKLENGITKEIPFFIYDKLQVGDSIIKNKNSDSVLYLRKNKIIKRKKARFIFAFLFMPVIKFKEKLKREKKSTLCHNFYLLEISMAVLKKHSAISDISSLNF